MFLHVKDHSEFGGKVIETKFCNAPLMEIAPKVSKTFVSFRKYSHDDHILILANTLGRKHVNESVSMSKLGYCQLHIQC